MRFNSNQALMNDMNVICEMKDCVTSIDILNEKWWKCLSTEVIMQISYKIIIDGNPWFVNGD